MFPEKQAKAREILQEWTDELVPQFGMSPVRVIVQAHELFDKERDRNAFSTQDAIFINPQKIIPLTDDFKETIKCELLRVWATRNAVGIDSSEFNLKATSVGL